MKSSTSGEGIMINYKHTYSQINGATHKNGAHRDRAIIAFNEAIGDTLLNCVGSYYTD